MSTEKMYRVNPEDHGIQNFCLKFLYLGFILINVSEHIIAYCEES